MQQLITKHTFEDTAITGRLEDLASVCNGKWHFTDAEVFIASADTRLLVNALPDLCNIVQHFAFESSKAQVLQGADDMGESMFNDSAIESFIESDVAYMTKGKLRALYYQIRERLSLKYDNKCEKASALKHVRDSVATAASVHINERDTLIVEMEECGLFEKNAHNKLMGVEFCLITAIADYIIDYAVCADYENYLDAMRINLGI